MYRKSMKTVALLLASYIPFQTALQAMNSDPYFYTGSSYDIVFAIEHRDHKKVEQLLENGISDPNSKFGHEQKTPLMFALESYAKVVSEGDPAPVKSITNGLVKFGASVVLFAVGGILALGSGVKFIGEMHVLFKKNEIERTEIEKQKNGLQNKGQQPQAPEQKKNTFERIFTWGSDQVTGAAAERAVNTLLNHRATRANQGNSNSGKQEKEDASVGDKISRAADNFNNLISSVDPEEIRDTLQETKDTIGILKVAMLGVGTVLGLAGAFFGLRYGLQGGSGMFKTPFKALRRKFEINACKKVIQAIVRHDQLDLAIKNKDGKGLGVEGRAALDMVHDYMLAYKHDPEKYVLFTEIEHLLMLRSNVSEYNG